MTNAIEINGTVAEDLTKATIVCRRQIEENIKYLREFVPGYEKCFLIDSASLIGIRETRHFKDSRKRVIRTPILSGGFPLSLC